MKLLPITPEARLTTLVATFLSTKGPATRDAYRQDLKCFQSYLITKYGIDSFQNLLLVSPGDLNFAVLGYR